MNYKRSNGHRRWPIWAILVGFAIVFWNLGERTVQARNISSGGGAGQTYGSFDAQGACDSRILPINYQNPVRIAGKKNECGWTLKQQATGNAGDKGLQRQTRSNRNSAAVPPTARGGGLPSDGCVGRGCFGDQRTGLGGASLFSRIRQAVTPRFRRGGIGGCSGISVNIGGGGQGTLCNCIRDALGQGGCGGAQTIDNANRGGQAGGFASGCGAGCF